MTKAAIAVVTPSFQPMIGGIERYVFGVGRELVRLGHRVRVFTPDSVLGRNMGGPRETVEGIEVTRVPVVFDYSYRVRLWPGLWSSLKRDDSDIIHVYSHDSYAVLAMLAARSGGTPLMVTTYGPFETNSNYGPVETGIFHAYDSLVSPYLFRRCDTVMVRYPEIAPWVEGMGVHRSRIRLEPSGVPADSLRPRDGVVFRAKHGIDGPVVMYLGRISAQKGVNFAIDAMKIITSSYRDARLVIIGPDYSGFSEALRRRCTELGVSENVLLLKPMQSEEDQMEALAACDVLVMPSSFEGFSQSVMKAMAQGKPVVVSNVGGLPFEVRNGECGILAEYGDPSSLAKGVVALLDDPDGASAMGARGRARSSLFTFDVLANNLSNVYSRVGA